MTTEEVAVAASDGKAEITTSDPRALEQEVELRRARMAGTIDELATRLAPKNLAQSGAVAAQEKALGFLTHRDGSLRVERVAALGVVVVGVSALVVVGILRKRR